MSRRKVILLNAANMDSLPVYPYAFIQVPAVARRANIEVVCRDLLGVPQEEWVQTIKGLLKRHEPDMILITLRNSCSMVYADYRPDREGENAAYFPIAQTKQLIEVIRSATNLPVAVGGFGFSFLARELMPILQPDFGVFGGAEEFFLYFEDILQGDYRHVANLLYFEGDRVVSNKRFYFPPAPEIEYTPQVIEEMLAFYEKFPEPGFQGAPVEIMRGCNHSCVFCCEPLVAGRRVQYRDPAVILGEIELLAKHGVREVCTIMSELNPEGNEFILGLADQIKAFNERQPAEGKMTWFGANYLLTFDRDDFQRLYASGFDGGWFDITGLDDENARAMRTPYRNETLVGCLQDYAQVLRYGFANPDEVEAINGGVEKRKTHWSMFLGNPATTMETIRRTLAVADSAGLAASFDSMHIVRPLRVFDYEKPSPETLAVTFSVDEQLRRVPYQQTLPSFAYPPALLEQLGSEEAIEEMFAYIGETFLSTGYKETRDWAAFLEEEAPGGIPDWTGERGELGSTEQAVDSFLKDYLLTEGKLLAAMDLPSSLAELEQVTPYSLAANLYDRWQSAEEIVAAICQRAGVESDGDSEKMVSFFVKAILYRFNVRLVPEYRPLFVLDT